MVRCLRFIALIVLVFPAMLRGQTLGIEFGGELDRLSGTINNPCGCPFDSARGTGFNSAINAEISIGSGFSTGVKTRFSHKNVSSSIPRNELAIIQTEDGNTDTATIRTKHNLDASISYVGATPFVEYKIPKVGIFIQTGVGAMFPVSSSLEEIRELDQTSVVVNGHVVPVPKFQNGTTTEPLEAEDPITKVNSPQYFASALLGDEVDILGAVFYGAFTYDLPLTNVRTTDSWKILSFGAVLGMKFDIK